MFYPVESLRRGGRFYLCWVADSYPLKFKNLPLRQLWSQDIRDLCDALNEVIVRESGTPSDRFSLRLSSQLVRGLARLYQRKVNVFVGNLCMMEAHILRTSNKKFEFHERRTRPRHFPKVVIREMPDEEHLEERIQNSGNVVARIQDITLQEADLPGAQLPTFGFGEENVDQAIQHLISRTLEVMVAGDEAAGQISGVDITHLQAQDMDMTRDNILTVPAVQMERISDNDMNLFRRSVAVSELQKEAEVPPIPDIQPELPAPTITELRVPESKVDKDTDRDRNRAGRLYLDLKELESLDVVEIAQRRKKNKLIIDKKTFFDGEYMRSRLADVKIESRYEHPSECTYDIHHIPAETLMREAGPRFTKASHIFTSMYVRNLGYSGKSSDMKIQDLFGELGKKRKRPTLNLERVEEEVVTPKGTLVQPPEEPGQPQPEQPQEPSAGVDAGNKERDICEIPTQILPTSSGTRRKSSEEKRSLAKRPKLASPKEKSAEKQHEVESVPREEPTHTSRPDGDIQVPEICINEQTPRISQVLQTAGLADLRASTEVQTRTSGDAQQKLSESVETPLGSLDRTKVSLGDSVKTTASMKFVLEQWGTEGTMTRIAKFFSQGIKEVNFESLLASGPSPPNRQRIVAARCFASLLKLKHHGFVTLTKNPVTLEINTISLTDKCFQ